VRCRHQVYAVHREKLECEVAASASVNCGDISGHETHRGSRPSSAAALDHRRRSSEDIRRRAIALLARSLRMREQAGKCCADPTGGTRQTHAELAAREIRAIVRSGPWREVAMAPSVRPHEAPAVAHTGLANPCPPDDCDIGAWAPHLARCNTANSVLRDGASRRRSLEIVISARACHLVPASFRPSMFPRHVVAG